MGTIPSTESNNSISPKPSIKKTDLPAKEMNIQDFASQKIEGHYVKDARTPGEVRAHSISKAEWTVTRERISEIAQNVILPVRRNELADRDHLQKIRSEAAKDLKSGKPSEEISRNLAQGYKELLSEIFQDGVKFLQQKLGKLPPCKYCIVALGSWARNETGPYSDFDSFIVTEKKTPESERYFTSLNTYAAERLERLGESQEPGQGLSYCWGMLDAPYQAYELRFRATKDEQGEATPSGPSSTKSTHRTSKGYEEFLSTQIEELKQKPSLTKSEQKILIRLQSDQENLQHPFRGGEELLAEPGSVNPHLDMGNLINGTVISGTDDSLYSAFMEKTFSEEMRGKEAVINIRQQIDDIQSFHPIVPSPIGPKGAKMPVIIFAKNNLFRLPQGVIEALALFHHLKELSTIDRIHALKKQGLLEPDLADRLDKTMNLLLKWRLKLQFAYGSEFDAFSPALGALAEFKPKIPQYLKEIEKEFELLETELKDIKLEIIKLKNDVKEAATRQKTSKEETLSEKKIDTAEKLMPIGRQLRKEMEELGTEIKKLKPIEGFSRKAEELEMRRKEIYSTGDKLAKRIRSTEGIRELVKDCQKTLLSKIEQKKPQPLSEEDLEDLQKIVIPTLWDLYTMAKNSYDEKRENCDLDVFKHK